MGSGESDRELDRVGDSSSNAIVATQRSAIDASTVRTGHFLRLSRRPLGPVALNLTIGYYGGNDLEGSDPKVEGGWLHRAAHWERQPPALRSSGERQGSLGHGTWAR